MQTAALEGAQAELISIQAQLAQAGADMENIRAVATVSENTKQEAIDLVRSQWQEEVASLQAIMKGKAGCSCICTSVILDIILARTLLTSLVFAGGTSHTQISQPAVLRESDEDTFTHYLAIKSVSENSTLHRTPLMICYVFVLCISVCFLSPPQTQSASMRSSSTSVWIRSEPSGTSTVRRWRGKWVICDAASLRARRRRTWRRR